MNETKRTERGQTLVIVALTLTVLMLMAGLAVDVGMAYNDRRDMQNAADAAVLAGAQQLCDGQTESAALAAATSVGMLNGATTITPTATLGEDARRMHAVAGTDAQTFFFRLIGIDSVPVSAQATAECSCAASIGGAWPIAFDKPTWDTLACLNDDGSVTGTGSPHIFVWAVDNSNWALAMGDDLCLYCDCLPFVEDHGISSVMAYGGNPFGSGDRGWIRLTTPPGFESTAPWDGATNCGADALKTWMEFGYPGQFAAGQCVPTESGNVDSALKAGERSLFEDVGVIIFNPTGVCTADDLIENSCPGDWKQVSSTGCVRIQEIFYSQNKLDLLGIATGKTCEINDTKVGDSGILATKLCDCPYSGSGSAGGAASTTCVPAVSIVQ